MKKYVIRIRDKYYTGTCRTGFYTPGPGILKNLITGGKELAKHYSYIMARITVWLIGDTPVARLHIPKIEKISLLKLKVTHSE